MKKSRLLALMLVAALMFSVFAGCAKTETETTAGGSEGSESEQQSGEGNVRRDIVIGEGSDVVSLDPIEITDNYSAHVLYMTNDGLMKLNENTEIVPWLAESVEEVSETEYIFHLREGVMFHNGEELKASDVKFTLERVKNSPKQGYLLAVLDKVEIIDDYTVRTTLSEPYAPFLLNLTESQTVIVNEKAVTEAGDKYAQNPVGTGPMKFSEWKANDHVTLVKNENYFMGAPEADSITIKVYPEASSRSIALETGEVDLITPVPPVDINRIKENPDLETIEMVSSTLSYVTLNTSKKPLGNLQVRQAMEYLTDKDTLIEVVREGYGVKAHSPIPTIGAMYDETLEDMYTFDVEKAKELLTEAGYADGFTVTMNVSSDDNKRLAECMQSEFAKANITMNIEVMEFGALLAYLNTGEHDMFIMGWSQGNTNPDKTLTNNFHSSMIGASGNRSWLNSPEVDGWIEAARRTTDTAVQKENYDKVQRYVMENAIWIPLYQTINVSAFNKDAEGIVWYKHGWGDFTNMVIRES